MVYKKNRPSQSINSNDSTFSSCLQMKITHSNNKIYQTLRILLTKPIFLPQSDPNPTLDGQELKENVPWGRGHKGAEEAGFRTHHYRQHNPWGALPVIADVLREN